MTAGMRLRGSSTTFPVTLFDAIDRRRWAELEDLLSPVVEYERPGYPPLRGRTEVMDFYLHQRIIAEGRHLLTEIAEDYNRVSCHGRFVGKDKMDNSLDIEFCDFYKLEAGLLVYRKTFFYVAVV